MPSRSAHSTKRRSYVNQPGRAHEAGQAVGEAVLLVDLAVDIGLLAAVPGPGLAVVALGRLPVDHSSPERPAERDLLATGVQAAPTPRVVRVVGVGGDDEQVARALRPGAHDERGVARGPVGRCVVGGERHDVEPAAPLGRDVQLDAGRPAATMGVGIVGQWMSDAVQRIRSPHLVSSRTPPLDPCAPRRGGAGGVDRQPLPRRVAERSAVALDGVVAGDLVGHAGALLASGHRRKPPVTFWW